MVRRLHPLGDYGGRSRERGQERVQASEVPRAVAAAMSIASSLGLTADDAIVLQDSNKLTLRLLPCDVLARVAHVEQQVAQPELDLLSVLPPDLGSPVAALEPQKGWSHASTSVMFYAVTLWTYYEPASPEEVSPADLRQCARAAACGHAQAECPCAAHFTDQSSRLSNSWRVRDCTPALTDVTSGEHARRHAASA